MIAGLFLYLIALIMGFAFGVFKKVPNQKKVTGIIDDLEQQYHEQDGRSTYTAFVKYNVNGKTYRTKTTYQSSSFQRGKKVMVHYNANDPNDSFVRSHIILTAIVSILFLMGTAVLIKNIFILY